MSEESNLPKYFEYDSEADCAYIRLILPPSLEVKSTKRIEPNILADYDELGNIVGIELINLTKLMGGKK